MGYVPALVDGTTVVSDSYAILLVSKFMFVPHLTSFLFLYNLLLTVPKLLVSILLYLCYLPVSEEKYPQHALLPQDIIKKSINYQVTHKWVAFCLLKGSCKYLFQITDNLFLLGCKYCFFQHSASSEYDFSSLEKLLANHAGKYATGDEIYLADLYLTFQLDNAINRFNLDMVFSSNFPRSFFRFYEFFHWSVQTEFPLLLKLYEVYCQTPSIQQIFAESSQQQIG
ncbi:putative glutathione transferase [Helianthus debilis subsp. tardiflorus]